MSYSSPKRPGLAHGSPRPAALGPVLWTLTAALLCMGGCATIRTTDPPRTATEQFMLSQAAGRAVSQLSTDNLHGRKIFVDATFFAASEQEFVLGELRAKLLASGVALVVKREDAEIVLEARSGGVGIDRYEYLLGLPSIPLGPAATPTAGTTAAATVVTPELAILKNTRQYGVASIAYVAYWAKDGTMMASSGPFVGRTTREDWWFFGAGPRTVGDIVPTERPH
jgi:hypothetical protein